MRIRRTVRREHAIRLDRTIFDSDDDPIEFPAESLIWIAWLGRRSIGYLVADAEARVLVRFGVLPSAAGQGVGLALVRALTAHARGEGERWTTYARANNTPSLRALVRAGFLPAGWEAPTDGWPAGWIDLVLDPC
jgi:GNAT superfamily N-acetyltransferase